VVTQRSANPKALNAAPAAAIPQIKQAWQTAGVLANGWRTNKTAIGTYGANNVRPDGSNMWLTFDLSPAAPAAQSSPPTLLTKAPLVVEART